MAHAVYGVGRWEGVEWSGGREEWGTGNRLYPLLGLFGVAMCPRNASLATQHWSRIRRLCLAEPEYSARGFGGMAPQEIFKIHALKLNLRAF